MSDATILSIATAFLMLGMILLFMPHWPDYYNRSSK